MYDEMTGILQLTDDFQEDFLQILQHFIQCYECSFQIYKCSSCEMYIVDWHTRKLTSFQYSTIVPTVQSWSEHSAVKA